VLTEAHRLHCCITCTPTHQAARPPINPSTYPPYRIWDLRAPGCQREYESRAAVNTVVLHPNQGELISGDQQV
jgi:hypothetical protein